MTELSETMDQTVKAMAPREGKYLTFAPGEEEYGIRKIMQSTDIK